VDQLLSASKGADVSVMDGGGIREEFPKGELTYGQLYKMSPFDNQLVVVPVKVSELAEAIRRNLTHDQSILSISGAKAHAECRNGKLYVELLDLSGKVLDPEKLLKVASSDYFLSSKNGPYCAADLKGREIIKFDSMVRDAIANYLRAHNGNVNSKQFYDLSAKRIEYPGQRPLRCDAP
jgi:2',3'-cyclic-nucleotide 2'-phosphodiesterase (5'-nucleotidase family)